MTKKTEVILYETEDGKTKMITLGPKFEDMPIEDFINVWWKSLPWYRRAWLWLKGWRL